MLILTADLEDEKRERGAGKTSKRHIIKNFITGIDFDLDLDLAILAMDPVEAVLFLVCLGLVFFGVLAGYAVLWSKPHPDIITLDGEDSFYNPDTG